MVQVKLASRVKPASRVFPTSWSRASRDPGVPILLLDPFWIPLCLQALGGRAQITPTRMLAKVMAVVALQGPGGALRFLGTSKSDSADFDGFVSVRLQILAVFRHVEVGSSPKEPDFDLFARVGRRGG